MRLPSPHGIPRSPATARPTRRAPRIAPALTLAVAALFLLPVPAAAYSTSLTTFSLGEATASVTFGSTDTDLIGPTLRVPADAYIDSGSFFIAGAAGTSSDSLTHTSDFDFSGANVASNLTMTGGTVALARFNDVIVLDDGNSFLISGFSGMHFDGTSPALDTFGAGYFTTGNLSALTGGWGTITADGYRPANTTIEFELLSPTDVLLVSRTNLSLGSPIPLDPIANPTVRLRGHFNATGAAELPTLNWVALGQRAGDMLLDTNRTLSAIRTNANSTGLSINTSSTSFTRAPSNPPLAIQGASYRSVRVNTATFFKVNTTWHAFAVVNNAFGWADTDIGHATSTDLQNWAWDAQPILFNGTAGQWDDTALSHPFVMENPSGSPRYYMYYSGWPNPTQFMTGLATSNDLYTWTKYVSNPIMSNSGGQWDAWNAAIRAVMFEGGQWKAWYVGTDVTTGGFNHMGYATSANGISWTKYASNPVLARNVTGGSIDGSDLQLASVRKDGTTYYAVFGCIPSGGAYGSCLATSTNGIGWTLYPNYLITPSGTGWDSDHTPATDIMIENGKFTLWYGGCSSGCGTEQVGRANGRFINGTISNIIDFGTRRPVSFDRITLNATVPGTSQVTLAVRSSANGLAWSGFETIPANGTITTTASNRYFEWRVSLNASLGSAPPVYRAVMLNYSTYAAQGRYESSDIIFGDLVTDPRLSVATTLPGPSVVSRQISTDRGATWTNAPNGVAVPLGPPAGELRYGLTLSGSTFQTPVIDAVTLDVNTTGLPADVTAKFGPTGNLIFSSSGPLSTTPAEVQLPLSQLNFIVSNAHLLDPSATSVDIPLHLSSTHFGTVEISGLVVNLTRPNPITATFFPSGPVTLAENQTAQFTTDAVSPYAPMFITWMVDGAEKTGARNMASFNFTPSFDMAGAHTVVCLVENDDTTVSNSWAVTVTEVNRPPTIRSITPTSPESFSHTASISLAVNATDLDGQPVTYAWQLDNTPLPAATAELILSALALGSHSAMVTVSDGLASSTASWTFEITDAAPVATLSPVGDQSMSHTGSLALSVTASDADGDTVTFAWRVDGVAVTATGSTFTLSRPATGVHTVEVRATGGSRSVTLFWNVTATNAAPQQVSRDPTAPSTVAFGSTMFFNISVSDADGDAVTAVWSVDGTIMAGSATQFQLPTDLTPGQHEVKYTGTDPDGAKVEALWGVTVGAAPAPPSTPAPGAWAAVAVLAAVAAIAGARRKRP